METRFSTQGWSGRFGPPGLFAAILNLAAFELAWVAVVMGGAAGWRWTATLPALAVVLLHLLFNRANLAREAALVGAVTLLGVVVETLFLAIGAVTYAGTAPGTIVPPPWILALWFAFGTLPHASLSWLSGRPLLQALLGGAFGPLSYVAGEALGAATLSAPRIFSLSIIAIGWALAMPAIYLIAGRLRRAPRLASGTGPD